MSPGPLLGPPSSGAWPPADERLWVQCSRNKPADCRVAHWCLMCSPTPGVTAVPAPEPASLLPQEPTLAPPGTRDLPSGPCLSVSSEGGPGEQTGEHQAAPPGSLRVPRVTGWTAARRALGCVEPPCGPARRRWGGGAGGEKTASPQTAPGSGGRGRPA
ncbi:hypothetical protein HJG60_008106 [Phyllostomus discolor]|uniref:Uncharacterized protein n=1 Tax=Phyllostomus discolor TaxID=89673 RepID=A0A834EVJ8_9CHIR|nr:hypothetical protein HJG60_008106 [Phyllostomus discolor]